MFSEGGFSYLPNNIVSQFNETNANKCELYSELYKENFRLSKKLKKMTFKTRITSLLGKKKLQ